MHYRIITKYLFIILLVALICVSCFKKKFLWQGAYITLETSEIPKEDFIVGEYIVISYAPIEKNKKASVLYEFVIIHNGKQIGLITLDHHPEIKSFGAEYFLEETRQDKHITYKFYSYKPEYEEIKNKVISILSENKYGIL